MDDIDMLIRKAAREKVQNMIETGEIILPPDRTAEAKQVYEQYRSGNKKIKTLVKLKGPFCVEKNVTIFGNVAVCDHREVDYYKMIWDRVSNKMLWGLGTYDGDINELAIRFDFITNWEKYPELPEAEQKGIQWAVTLLTWESGHSQMWEFWARMHADLACAAELSRQMNRLP